MARFVLPSDHEDMYCWEVKDELGIPEGDSYILCDGRPVSRSDLLVPGKVYYVFPRALGGKGGFGSMLRAIGAQIEKTTNHEACRDLSGRRIRDVNNEKKLKDWLTSQAEKRRQEREEREERRRAKRARYLNNTPAEMNDPEFYAQLAEMRKNSEEAFQQGLARKKEIEEIKTRKRKADSSLCALDKDDRWSEWAGLDLEDSDSDSNGAGCSADPGPSTSSSESRDGPASPKVISPTATVTSATVADSSSPEDVPSTSSLSQAALLSSAKAPPASSTTTSCAPTPPISLPTDREASSPVSAENGAAKVDQDCKSQTSTAAHSLQSLEPIDLEQCSGAEDLHPLGMEHLKQDLMRRGLKCGGSLEERAQRLFSVKGLAPDEIPASLMPGKGKGKGKGSKK